MKPAARERRAYSRVASTPLIVQNPCQMPCLEQIHEGLYDVDGELMATVCGRCAAVFGAQPWEWALARKAAN